MKKLYFLASFLMLAGYLTAQTFQITPSTSIFATTDPRNAKDMYIHMTNLTQGQQALRWKGTTHSYPNGWIVTICDNFACFGIPHTNTEAMSPVGPGDSAFLKATFVPAEIPGTGVVAFLVWDANDSAGTAVELTMTINANSTAVSTQMSNDLFTVSPMPANSHVVLRAKSGNLDKGEAKIYNLNGQVVLQQQVAATPSAEFNTSGFAPGIYMLNYTSKAGSMTQKIVVAH